LRDDRGGAAGGLASIGELLPDDPVPRRLERLAAVRARAVVRQLDRAGFVPTAIGPASVLGVEPDDQRRFLRFERADAGAGFADRVGLQRAAGYLSTSSRTTSRNGSADIDAGEPPRPATARSRW
jgi:hypothetical protein